MANLTTLGAVKTWLGPTATANITADPLLNSLITATSADFLRAIERPDLLQNVYTENRVGDGSARLVLRHWPVLNVTSLKVGTAVIPAQAPPADGWYLDTSIDPERAIVLYLSGPLAFQDAAPVVVTYLAGYEEVPEDIAQAVTTWVAWRYKRKASTGQTQARGLEGESTHFEEFGIPPDTQRVIAAYKRKFAAYGTDSADRGIGDDDDGPAKPARGGR